MLTGCLRTIKVATCTLGDYKVVLVSYETYGTLSIYLYVFKTAEKECQIEWNYGQKVDQVHWLFEEFPLSGGTEKSNNVLLKRDRESNP